MAAVLAAGLAAAAMAFLGAQDDADSTATPASTVPADELASDDADAAPGGDGGEAPAAASESGEDVGPVSSDASGTDEPDLSGDAPPEGSAADDAQEDAPETESEAPVEASDTVAPDPSTGDAAEPSGEAGHARDTGDDGEVAESRAVVRNGQIYLEGAVPTQAASDEIEALAAEILGPDNVFNEYVIDERAGDPSLGNITVEDTINFATGSSVLLPESEGLLTQGLLLMTVRPAVIIEIVGHTDDRGSEEYNQQLSEERAAAVKQWFVERDVDPNRLITSGAGESQPIADNDTEEGRRLNRRIQLFLQNILGDG